MRSVTTESSQRTELVRARVEREALAKTMSREEWLASLDIEQDFYLLASDESVLFERAHELINKTNQFNTTGKRWQLSELQEFFAAGGACLLTSLKDRTMDNGVVGAALIGAGELVQVVLSCRVFGLGAELGLGRVATLISLSQAGKAIGRIVDTGKNFACHKYYEAIGFEKRGEHFVGVQACAAPNWIKVAASADESLNRYLMQ
jgi:FkbH-like protein